jgi:Holliday junction resolvase RusA-like endonuclease
MYRLVLESKKRYHIEPVPAPRQNRGSRWNPRMSKTIARYHVYRDLIRIRHVEVPDCCYLRFEMPVPRRGHQRIGKPHTLRPDLDNLVKGLLDAVFTEDAHIHRIYAEKVWALRGAIVVGELIDDGEAAEGE